jgi:AraC-like DNA-binding protein
MMNTPIDSFDEIEIALMNIRKQAKTKQKFPQELWNAIIGLTKTHSIQEVSQRLNISPTYLKRKIRMSRESSPLDFREISLQNTCSEMVSIELISNFGIKAKIQGPPSCLSYLGALLRG